MTNKLTIAVLALQICIVIIMLYQHNSKVAAVKTDNGYSELISKVGNIEREVQALRYSIKDFDNIVRLTGETHNDQVTDFIPETASSVPAENSKPIDIAKRNNAIEQSNEIVTNAISNMRWSMDDTKNLMYVSTHLSRDDKKTLLDRIATAVNNQELIIEAPLPPM